jgi:hypothetical protein
MGIIRIVRNAIWHIRQATIDAGGGLPGSDIDFMRQQHLDHYGVIYGIMNPLSPSGQGEQPNSVPRSPAPTMNASSTNGPDASRVSRRRWWFPMTAYAGIHRNLL